jgi:hypothetical protein
VYNSPFQRSFRFWREIHIPRSYASQVLIKAVLSSPNKSVYVQTTRGGTVFGLSIWKALEQHLWIYDI